MSKKKTDLTSLKPETRLVVAGREYAEHGIVNPAVYHASTITFPTVKALHDRDQGRRKAYAFQLFKRLLTDARKASAPQIHESVVA